MPRRHLHLCPGRGWELWNLLSSLGVVFPGFGVLFFRPNVISALRQGHRQAMIRGTLDARVDPTRRHQSKL